MLYKFALVSLFCLPAMNAWAKPYYKTCTIRPATLEEKAWKLPPTMPQDEYKSIVLVVEGQVGDQKGYYPIFDAGALEEYTDFGDVPNDDTQKHMDAAAVEKNLQRTLQNIECARTMDLR